MVSNMTGKEYMTVQRSRNSSHGDLRNSGRVVKVIRQT